LGGGPPYNPPLGRGGGGGGGANRPLDTENAQKVPTIH